MREDSGEVTAYDGDRIMAVFIGDLKNTRAARTALKINHAVKNIINPQIASCYPQRSFALKHVVGIDTSPLWVARTGVRGANDLVWVGRAANYAAKLTSLPDAYPSYITKDVFDALHEPSRVSSDGRSMWETVYWTAMGNATIYRSLWTWTI